ncbi:MAG: GNAT family N-acetyltransferase [Bacteroidales bacterium]|nr:GNAT family N-acetyltransferase [Bacteroidales bacterium]
MELSILVSREPVHEWDEMLDVHHGSIYLYTGWLNGIASVQREPVYFLFKDNEEVVAMLSGFIRPVCNGPHKQLFFYSGIASAQNNPEILIAAKKALLDYARKNNYYRVILKSYDYNTYLEARIKPYCEFKRSECVLDLNCSENDLINGFKDSYRRNMKRGLSRGAAFGFGFEAGLVDAMLLLMNETQRVRCSKGYGKYGLLTMPFLNRDEMVRMLEQRNAAIFYIRLAERIVSAQFVVMIRTKAYGILMGTSEDGYHIYAPSVLFYKTALYLREEGFKSYNLGGIPIGRKNKGVEKFKLDMGARLYCSSEEATGFLLSPLRKYNFLLWLRKTVSFGFLPWKVKNFLFKIIDLFLKGREHY